jgi:hypothetical protein
MPRGHQKIMHQCPISLPQGLEMVEAMRADKDAINRDA